MTRQTKQYSGIGWKGRALIGLVSIVISMLPIAVAFAESGVSVHVRIFPNEYSSALEQLRGADYDVVREDELAGHIDVVVDEDSLVDLYQYGSVMVIERSRPFSEVQRERDAIGMEDAPDARYKTFSEVLDILNQVQAAHPAIAQVVDLTEMLGTPPTWGNRHLYAMKISDNVAQDEDEPVILFDSLHHARELNTIEASLGLINQLTAEYDTNPDTKALVDKLEIWVVPVVNPDGLEFVWSNNNLWRKNRRNNGGSFGVDLNRNYPFKWGQCGSTSSSPGSDTYRGPALASEPETQTMMALGQKVRPAIYNSYHSSGRLVLWSYRCGTMADAPVIRSIRNAYRNTMQYTFGTPSASGESYEWFYNQISSVAFLTEMDAGDWQPAFTVTESEVERLKPGWNYLLGLLAEGRYPLVQGHVTDLSSGTPVEAQISSSLVNFVEGERRASEPLAGRFAWFLERNKQHELTFSAAGFESASELVVPTAGVTDLEISLVTNAPASNQAPVVNAGSNQTAEPGVAINLDATVSDDGLPGGALTYSWSQVSGPGSAAFANPNAEDTTVELSAAGSYVLRLEVNDGLLTGSGEITITVQQPLPPGSLIISEVLYDAAGPDDGLEWVELYNTTDQAIELSAYSLGNGGADYTYSVAQLSGTIGPGQTFVVGGPTSNANNGNPTFDQAINFTPDLQNANTAADGVALFNVPANQISSSSVPIDALVYGADNGSGLIDETGVANTPDAADSGPGLSIERTGLSGGWVVQSTPTPNSVSLSTENRAPSFSLEPINKPAASIDVAYLQSLAGDASDPDGDLLRFLKVSGPAWLNVANDGALSGTPGSADVGLNSFTVQVMDGGGLSATATLNITVESGPPLPVVGLILSEVLYNPRGADGVREWVELYNPTAQAIDLSAYSLGHGGNNYTRTVVQLSGTIGPGQTFVVGGPTSNNANGNPTYDQVFNFAPNLQNGGATADGVALFNVLASEITSTTVPIDAVVYGTNNNNGLMDETGVANAPDVPRAGAGDSVERTDLAGSWVVQATPTPNTVPFGN